MMQKQPVHQPCFGKQQAEPWGRTAVEGRSSLLKRRSPVPHSVNSSSSKSASVIYNHHGVSHPHGKAALLLTHGFSSRLMAAGVRRMTTRKHTGLCAQLVWRDQPLQTPNSGKGYAILESKAIWQLLCFMPKPPPESGLLFHYTPSDDPKADFEEQHHNPTKA